MVNYTKLQDRAQKLIGKFGTDWVHKRTTKGSYNPSTNLRATVTTVETTVKAVKVDFKRFQKENEVIEQGDIRLLVEAKNLISEPTTQDEMVKGSSIWQIISIDEVKPADLAIYYSMHLRK